MNKIILSLSCLLFSLNAMATNEKANQNTLLDLPLLNVTEIVDVPRAAQSDLEAQKMIDILTEKLYLQRKLQQDKDYKEMILSTNKG